MNNVISKTPTVRVITGLTDTNLNNYPENIWLKNNGGHDLPDCEPKYMKWHDPESFDYVVEMSEWEKSLFDSNEIETAKQNKIKEIKNYAYTEIEKTQWVFLRSLEQTRLGIEQTISTEELNSIINRHQAIRWYSDFLEDKINSSSLDEIKDIQWRFGDE